MRIRRQDIGGIVLMLAIAVLFFYVSIWHPRMSSAGRPGLGPDWECSNAMHGICIKRPAATENESGTETQASH